MTTEEADHEDPSGASAAGSDAHSNEHWQSERAASPPNSKEVKMAKWTREPPKEPGWYWLQALPRWPARPCLIQVRDGKLKYRPPNGEWWALRQMPLNEWWPIPLTPPETKETKPLTRNERIEFEAEVGHASGCESCAARARRERVAS